jgi:hypothetical protein
MAIISDRLTALTPGFLANNKARTFTRLVKQDIVRQPEPGRGRRRVVGTTGWKETVRMRTSRHDPRTPSQIAHREPMRWARWAWWCWGQGLQDYWEPLRPTNFACEAVKKCHAMRCPSDLDEWNEGTSNIDIEAVEAAAVSGGVVLTFNTDTPQDNWGVAIHRGTTTPFTPTQDNLVKIVPVTNDQIHTYLDADVIPGTYYYALFAYDKTGRPGPVSDEVTATVP